MQRASNATLIADVQPLITTLPSAAAAAASLVIRDVRFTDIKIVPRYNRSTYGRRAFPVAGPTTWNSLTAVYATYRCLLRVSATSKHFCYHIISLVSHVYSAH